MAVHSNTQSMLRESLPEMLMVAKYCIEFRKDTSIWPAPGCGKHSKSAQLTT